MSKYFNYLLIGLLVFSSCKKSSSDPAIGTISANIDGSVTTFNVNAKASNLQVTGGYGIKIFGYKKDPSTSWTSLTLTIARGTPITTGTYIENSGGNPLVTMQYFYDVIFGSGFTTVNYGASNKVTITITEITGSYIKGSFSGDLQGPGLNNTTAKASMSGGVFYVSF